MNRAIQWMEQPEQHDYVAALSYLSLHYPLERSGEFVHELRCAEIECFKAKDILRASGLHLLPQSNSHIERNLKKIEEGKRLSPILLVRSDRLIIADGFHRVCAVYLHDEDALIPCKIVGSIK